MSLLLSPRAISRKISRSRGDSSSEAVAAGGGGTTPASVYAAQIDRNALVAEAGLDWRATASTTVGIAYSAAIGERTRDHALKGRFEVRF